MRGSNSVATRRSKEDGDGDGEQSLRSESRGICDERCEDVEGEKESGVKKENVSSWRGWVGAA